LNFGGDAKELSKLLQELSEIDGAELSICFAHEAGEEPRQWSIDHNGWANPQHLQFTIYLGEGAVKLDELQLPMIRGRMRKDAVPSP
jgi:hypothetical protein